MREGRRKLELVGAAALGAALLVSCAAGPSEPEVKKRYSDFQVVRTFKVPGRGLADMTYAGGHIWLADEEGAGLVYRINPTTGSVVSSAATSYGTPSAICTDGTYLYIAHGATGNVWRHRLEPRLGELASFPTGLADVRGMYFYEGTFYLFDQATGGVYEFDENWSPRRVWRVGPGDEFIRGMTRADGRVWSADWRNGWLNRHRKVNFDIDRKFCTSGQHPAGLAWDGSYLFLGDMGGRMIYKLNIRPGG
jgi:hypothetical protein